MNDFLAAIQAFEDAARRASATFAAISDEAWTAPAAKGPLVDIVEHMAISNDLFRARVEKLTVEPERPSACAVLEDGEIPHLFERAAEPPGVAQPTGTWHDRREAIRRFDASAQMLAEAARRASGDMRRRSARHPLFGPLDGVQWMAFAAAHTERHRSEIIGRTAAAPRPAAP